MTFSPAAFHTIRTHLADTGTTPGDYDLIVTGDLGTIGVEALIQLCREDGLSIGGKLTDCGTGALLSPTSTQQSLPIPGICHAVCCAAGGNG